MKRKFEAFIFVVVGFLWITALVAGETELETRSVKHKGSSSQAMRLIIDYNNCSFYYWKMDWHSAVRTCENDHKRLLCYKSKKEIDDITEAFRLSAYSDAELEIWLSYRNCSGGKKFEECLSLHIDKNSEEMWHFFQKDCTDRFPFVCCIDSPEHTTTASLAKLTTTSSVASSPSDSTISSSTSTSTSTASFRSMFCKKVRKRGLLWPDTAVGKLAVLPCPGKSVGKAQWYCEKAFNGTWSHEGPDLSECRSLEIQNLKDKFNTSSASEVISELEKVFQDHQKEIFGEDLADVISLMTALPNRLYEEMKSIADAPRWTATKESIEKSMSVFDRVIELNDSWKDITEKRRSGVGTSLLSTIDGMGALLADAMMEAAEEQSIIGKNIALQVLKAKHGKSLELPRWAVTSHYSHKGKIVLLDGYDNDIDVAKGNVSVVFTLYNDMSNILSPAQNQAQPFAPASINSAIVSATVTQERQSQRIDSEVKIVVEHLIPSPNNTACVFWNIESDQWDTNGCRLESSNETYSFCICNHLTNFAVLMDYREVMDEVNQLPFHYITLIGCTISIISLVLCVVVFTCYSYHSRHSWGLRYVIHRNLCLTLLIANLVLVLGLDRTDNQRMCAVIAGLLHYFFLSAFSWMLLEGVHIYLLLVVVFASRRSHSEKYYIFGYGFPMLIVAITAISRPLYYGTDEVCWLSAEKGTIWAFMGPVAAILTLNTAALILAQWKASKISVKDDNMALVKRWLRVTLILFPVLGITWIFGFLYVGKHFEVAGYLFAIFNSLQGFCIFIFHCLMDKKARSMVVASFKKKSASVNTGSSGTQKKKDPKQPLKERTPVILCPVDNSNKSRVLHKTFQLPSVKKDWSKWRKPWSFCFDMPISENGSQETQTKEKETPKAIVVHWNNLSDVNS